MHDERGRLLVVLRARPPSVGTWSLPGGRVEPDESDDAAVRRELREETGLDVSVGRLVGTVDRDAPGGATYEIHDYAGTVTGGQLRAGDDAADVRWVSAAELTALTCAPGLVETLRGWGALPTN